MATTEIKNNFFQAKQNQDLHPKLLPNGQYRSLMNGRTAKSESDGVGAIENIRGNTSLSSLLDSTAVVIGTIRDQQQDRIYYFIVGAREDAIYEYNEETDFARPVLRSSKAGVLNFSVDHLITGVNLIGEGEDRLLFWTDGYNPPRRININRVIERHGSILDGIVINEETGERTGGFTEDEISVVKAPPLFPPNLSTIELDDQNDDTSDEDDFRQEQNLKDKFVRFAYRWKYVDGEYSVFSPFSDIAFSAGRFAFDRVNGQITSMENLVRAVEISFNTGPRDVVEVELLYKSSDSPTVYVVESYIKANENWRDSVDLSNLNETEKPITFSSNKLYRILPERELLRVFDNVPLIAHSQEIIENRLVYGHYTDRYNIEDIQKDFVLALQPDGTMKRVLSDTRSVPITIDLEARIADNGLRTFEEDIDPDLIGDTGVKNLKSDRDYEIGIVYGDNVGRQTPVLTSADNALHVPAQRANRKNRIEVEIKSKAPEWATYYRFFIKSNRTESYNVIPLDIVTQPDDNEFKWFRIAPPDQNKVKVGDHLLLKVAENEFVYADEKQERVVVRIEEIGFRERNFLELETPRVGELRDDDGHVYDEGAVITLQKPGIWMRVRNLSILGQDKEALQDSGTSQARSNNARDVANRPIVGDTDNYQDATYYYPGSLIENPDVDEASVTFSGTYTPGVVGTNTDFDYTNNYEGNPTTGAGPMRIEVIIEPDNTYSVASFFSPSHDDPQVRRYVYNLGGTAIPTTDAAVAIDNGVSVAFNLDPADYNIGDKFTCIWRRGDNFMWRCYNPDHGTPNGVGRYAINSRRSHLMLGQGNIEDGLNGGSLIQFGLEQVNTRNLDGEPVSLPFAKNEYFTPQNVFYDNIEEWLFESGLWSGASGETLSGTDRRGDRIGIHQMGFWRGLPTTPGDKFSFDDALRILGAGGSYYSTTAVAAAAGASSGAVGVAAGIAAVALPFVIGASAIITLISVFAKGKNTSNDFRLLSATGARLMGGQRDDTDPENPTFMVTEDSTPFPLYMFIQSGTYNGGNKKKADIRLKGNMAFVQGTGASEGELSTVPLVFETLPDETSLDIYYEIGDTFKCENGVHYGNDPNDFQVVSTVPEGQAGTEDLSVSKTVSVTLDYFNCIAWNNGIESQAIRDEYGTRVIDSGAKASNVIDEYEQTNNFASLIYSGVFNSATGINNLNQFSAHDIGLRSIIKEMDDSYGSIQKLYAENTDLIVFQEDKVNRVQVDKNALFNADGTSNVAASSAFLNQTIPFAGEYGISRNPESFAVYGYDKYFADKKRGVILQINGNNQIAEISDVGMRDFFRDNLAQFPLVLGYYDDYHDQFLLTMRENFVDPTVAQQSIPLLLSRQGFLSRNDACRYPQSKLQFTEVYEFYQDDEPPGFQVGDIIYHDIERTSVFNGDDDWFVFNDNNIIGMTLDELVSDIGVFSYTIADITFPEIMADQIVEVRSFASSTTYPGIVTQVGDDTINIRFTGDSPSAGDVTDGRFVVEADQTYVINIDNFGIVRRKLDCLGIAQLNHDAFRASLRGFSSPEEACANGIVGRILYHNGDDATPDVGDSIFDTPYGDDEFQESYQKWSETLNYGPDSKAIYNGVVYESLIPNTSVANLGNFPDSSPTFWVATDDPVDYKKGRTTRRGWYQIFDGADFEDYVIRLLEGQVVAKIRCASIRAGRTPILIGNGFTRRSNETDEIFATRVCRSIPANTAYHDGDEALPVIGDIMYYSDYLDDPLTSGNYPITGGFYVTINNDDGVISSITQCVIRVCLRDLINTYGLNDGLLDNQIKTSNEFIFRGIVDEDIFGSTDKQLASTVTVRWSARGSERYPANPNDFYEQNYPNGLLPGDAIHLTNEEFLTASAGDENLEYSILEFCHNRTLVPQFIAVRYYNDDDPDIADYPSGDPATFLATIFDTTGNLGTGAIECPDEIYYDRTALTEIYYTDDLLQTPLDGTQGRAQGDLIEVTIDGELRYGLWWAFADTDNGRAEEALLIDNMGRVLQRRSADHPFEILLAYHETSELVPCSTSMDNFETYFGNVDDFACASSTVCPAGNPGDTVFTSFLTADGGTPPPGFYVWFTDFDTPEEGDDQRYVRQWDGTQFIDTTYEDGVDNCPVSLQGYNVRFSTNQEAAHCGGGNTVTVYPSAQDPSSTGNITLYTNPFGPRAVPVSELPSGWYQYNGNFRRYNAVDNTITTSSYTCPVVCSDSNANNQGAMGACTYDPYCNDPNASNYLEGNVPGASPSTSASVCEYDQRTATYVLTNTITGSTEQIFLSAIPDPQTGIDGGMYSFEDPAITINPGYHFQNGGTFSGDSLTGTFAGSNVTVARSIGGTVGQTFTEMLGCTDSNAANYDDDANTDNGSCVYSRTYTFASSSGNACAGAADVFDIGTEVTVYTDQAIQPTFYATADPTGAFAAEGWYTLDGAEATTVFRIGSDGKVAENAICPDPFPPPSNLEVTQFSGTYPVGIRREVRLEWDGPSGTTHMLLWEGNSILFSESATGNQSMDSLLFSAGLNTADSVYIETTTPGTFTIKVTVTDANGSSAVTTFNITTGTAV